MGRDFGGQGEGHIAAGLDGVNVRCLLRAAPARLQLVGMSQKGMGADQHTASVKKPEFVESQDDAEELALGGLTAQCLR